jgi:transcriptional regulator with XRE-family HTH domain
MGIVAGQYMIPSDFSKRIKQLRQKLGLSRKDLAELSEIAKAAIGLGLKLSVRLELGSTSPPSPEAVAKINQLLQEISEQLQLRPS